MVTSWNPVGAVGSTSILSVIFVPSGLTTMLPGTTVIPSPEGDRVIVRGEVELAQSSALSG